MPVGYPEHEIVALAGLVSVRVHRLQNNGLAEPGIGRDDLFNAKYLHGRGMPAVGNNGVFMACLAEEDGLGRLGEEIDGGGASEAKCALVDAKFEDLLAFRAFKAGEEEDNLGLFAKAGLRKRLEAGEVEEQEFFREGEVLLEKAMAIHRAADKWQKIVFRVEADNAQPSRIETDQALLVFWIAELNLDALVREELVERIDHACVAS